MSERNTPGGYWDRRSKTETDAPPIADVPCPGFVDYGCGICGDGEPGEPMHCDGCADAVRLRAALRALLASPYGCVFCDSGKFRNPAKPYHRPDCGFLLAAMALGDSRV